MELCLETRMSRKITDELTTVQEKSRDGLKYVTVERKGSSCSGEKAVAPMQSSM